MTMPSDLEQQESEEFMDAFNVLCGCILMAAGEENALACGHAFLEGVRDEMQKSTDCRLIPLDGFEVFL